MSKLFEVEITITAIVIADDMDHAFCVADSKSQAIISDDQLDGLHVTREIKPGDRLPDGWDRDCCAYGDDGNERIGLILDAQPPVIERDTKTIDMFAVAAP